MAALPRAGELAEDGGQAMELVEVGGRQLVQAFFAVGGEPDACDAPVIAVGPALDVPGRFGAVDEFDGAVVAQQQVTGEVPDRRALLTTVAFDSK